MHAAANSMASSYDSEPTNLVTRGRFYGAAAFNPKLIVLQIIFIQSVYYAVLSVLTQIIFTAWSVPRQVDIFFVLSVPQKSKWPFGFVQLLNAVILGIVTASVVERTKKCFDHCSTVVILHILICWYYNRSFPFTAYFWVFNILIAGIGTVVAERICMRTELREIFIDKRKRGGADSPEERVSEALELGTMRTGGGDNPSVRNYDLLPKITSVAFSSAMASDKHSTAITLTLNSAGAVNGNQNSVSSTAIPSSEAAASFFTSGLSQQPQQQQPRRSASNWRPAAITGASYDPGVQTQLYRPMGIFAAQPIMSGTVAFREPPLPSPSHSQSTANFQRTPLLSYLPPNNSSGVFGSESERIDEARGLFNSYSQQPTEPSKDRRNSLPYRRPSNEPPIILQQHCWKSTSSLGPTPGNS